MARLSLGAAGNSGKDDEIKNQIDKQIQDQTGDEEKALISYINANYINGLVRNFSEKSFIACTAPIPKTLCKFWQMIWENQVPLVMMLCSEREIGFK